MFLKFFLRNSSEVQIPEVMAFILPVAYNEIISHVCSISFLYQSAQGYTHKAAEYKTIINLTNLTDANASNVTKYTKIYTTITSFVCLHQGCEGNYYNLI